MNISEISRARKILSIMSFICLSFMLTSCTLSKRPVQTGVDQITTIQSTNGAILTVPSKTSTLIPAVSPAGTIQPRLTIPATVSPEPAPSLVMTIPAQNSTKVIPTLPPSVTPTITATLSSFDSYQRVIELLQTNGGCKLPCFWGITPGTTTAQQARDILEPLSSLSEYNVFHPDSGTILLDNGLKDDQLLDVFINYLANQDTVYSVSFEARDLKKLVDQQSGGYAFQDVFDSSYFGEILDFYMLHQVLAAYGRPSSVLLTTWGKIPTPRYGQGNFKLILLYPEQGIAVQYATEMHMIGKNVEGCLTNAHVEMSLFPARNVDAFDEYLAPTDWKGRLAYYKSLEEVTSLSIDDFYQMFQQPTEKCLVTPAHLWPLPEK